jgi:methionine salvage enolase-phosphatase E1
MVGPYAFFLGNDGIRTRKVLDNPEELKALRDVGLTISDKVL